MRHTESGLEEYAISLETGSRVQKLLAQLPEAQREVVVLAYFYGHTQSEIAKKTKQPLAGCGDAGGAG
ncbi:MAG: hypothetical protein EXR48_07475 [Dehalococcoidia bacterium]|nr:hypothetical protein [Dehalococcoidia bacterium]